MAARGEPDRPADAGPLAQGRDQPVQVLRESSRQQLNFPHIVVSVDHDAEVTAGQFGHRHPTGWLPEGMVSDSPVLRVPISGPGPPAPGWPPERDRTTRAPSQAYPGPSPGIFGSWVLVWPGRRCPGAGSTGT